MGPRDTILKLKELANEPVRTAEEAADDFAAAEMLLLACEPALSGAAVAHCMGLFRLWRDRAMLRRGVSLYGVNGEAN